MKKIIVLAMYCNQEFFLQEELLIRLTWAKPILEGKFPNMTFFSYTASEDGKYHIDYKNNRIYVPSDDSLRGTAEKTMKCFRLIEKIGMEYDFIFRTNCSTYINLDLLNDFSQVIYNNEDIWTNNTSMPHLDTGPYMYCTLFGGNAVLLSKRLIQRSIETDNIVYTLDNYPDRAEVNSMSRNKDACIFIDDNFFSFLLNNYWIRHKTDHSKFYKKFGLIGNDSYIDFNPYNLEIIAISYRFTNRTNEESYCLTIHEELSQKSHPKLDDTIDVIHNDETTFVWVEDHQLKRAFLTHELCLEKIRELGWKIPYTVE